MVEHLRFSVDTRVAVVLLRSQEPRIPGSNEYTNGLLRHYFPKRASIGGYSQGVPTPWPSGSWWPSTNARMAVTIEKPVEM